ncbi:MFS transporter [Sphingobium sufflavum]|nr:MFS transporter [Sphingobium sufflavum]MCE7795823.1 MFS transporter [Sphingobium sufflavum]
MFPPRQRASAMSLYLMGAPIGVAAGLGLGGWTLEEHGWRFVLMCAGVPGIILGPLILLTVRNIAKGLADGITRSFAQPGLLVTLKMLVKIRTLPFLVAGATLQTLLASGLVGWIPAFLQRTHGLSPAVIGGALGAAMGTGSLIGHLVGGPFSDYLSRRDMRWPFWLGSCIVLTAAGLSLLAFAGPVGIFFPVIGLQFFREWPALLTPAVAGRQPAAGLGAGHHGGGNVHGDASGRHGRRTGAGRCAERCFAPRIWRGIAAHRNDDRAAAGLSCSTDVLVRQPPLCGAPPGSGGATGGGCEVRR